MVSPQDEPSTDERQLATLLRHWRVAAGLSQEALAERAGLSVNGIAQLETGKRTAPRASTLRMLADALNLTSDQRIALAVAARRGAEVAHPTPDTEPDPAPVTRGRRPVARTALVGRDPEIAEAMRLLRAGDLPLVTLTGPGGVGKTRLALAVADAWSAGSADAIVWVELASVGAPEMVPGAVARSAGVTDQPARPVVDALADALRDQPALLVLDNCEHLLPAAGAVSAHLLERCPDLRILATSRSPLHIRGERTLAVPTLALPDPDHLPTLAELAAIDAVALFAQRARAARPDFTLDARNAGTVADICCRLDGLPLALELAAARMRALSPAALQGLLEERLRLLVGGPTDAQARLQTLRAAVSWSYELLTPSQQRIFRHLGVFAGGCTLDAVATIAGDEDHIDVLEGVEALLDQSLLVRLDGQDGEVRFGMLETFRAFALEQLAGLGEADEARSQHAAWFLALAESQQGLVDGPRHVTTMERLAAEHANLLQALAWLERREESERMLRLASAMMPWWHAAGTLSEATEWLERALELGGAAVPSEIRATALVAAGQAALLTGDFDRGRSRLRDGIAMARAHDARDAEMRGLYWLGCAEFFSGHFEEGRAYSTACLALARETGARHHASAALWSLGFIAMSQDDHALARRQLSESLALAREVGSPILGAFVQCELANLDYRQGRFASAQARATEALAMGRVMGHRGTTGQSLGLLAEVARARGDWADAARFSEEHLAMLRPGGVGIQVAWGLRNLAYAAIETDTLARAGELFVEGLAMFRDQQSTLGMASTIAGIASVAVRDGQPAHAERLIAAVGAMLEAAGLSLAPADAIALERTASEARAAVRPVEALAEPGGAPPADVTALVAEALAIGNEIATRPDTITPIARHATDQD